MASSLTYYTELQTPTVNGDVDLWGNILNATTDAWDRALAGIATASLAGGNWTPSTTEGECLVLRPTGVLGTNRQIIVPAKNRRYVVKNDTTGAFTVTIKTSGGTGIVCNQGILSDVYCDGTDMYLRAAGGSSSAYPIGTSGATVPLNNSNNTSSGNNTYSGTSAFTAAVTMSGGSGSPVTFTYADNGALVGPILTMLRDSASPAASDLLASLLFQGRDSAANLQTYGSIGATITDATSTSEDGTLDFWTAVAGTVAARIHIGAGFYTDGVTGGDKGAGSINVATAYLANVQINATTATTAIGTSGATIPLLNGNNTYSGTSAFTGTVTASGGSGSPATFTYADNGALVGPTVTFLRDSASPAASDLLASLVFQGRDSAANLQTYTSIGATITDATSTSEDATQDFYTVVAGTVAARVHIGAGIYSDGVSGGDKGAGSANFTTIYQANTALGTAAFVATGTSGATIPLLNGNNTYSGTGAATGVWTFSGGAGSPAVFQWSDDGAGGGPNVYFERISASPAASDRIGGLYLRGRDSAANAQDYALIDARIDDPTSTSEDASILFTVATAGTLLTQMELGLGLAMRSTTVQGTGTINATAYYKSGVLQGVTPTIQVITASGTWTRPAGCLKIKVTVVGGGGGGGGADSDGATHTGSGGGGGAGGFAIEDIDVSALASASVTVGAAGTAGSATGGNGGSGGTSDFGTGPLLQATGGTGGTGSGTSASTSGDVSGGTGGVGTLGDANGGGQAGGVGAWRHGDFTIGGLGGSSILGGGGRGVRTNSTSSTAGGAASAYGAGGGGAACAGTTTGALGGVGTAGVVIVEEYY